MHMRAMGSAARSLNFDPDKALFAKAQHARAAGIADDDAIRLRQARHSVQKPFGAKRTHALLIAGQRQHRLPPPGMAIFGQQGEGQHGSGNAALHIRNTAPIKPTITQQASQGGHGPGQRLINRIGIEMAVIGEQAARPVALDAHDQIGHLRVGFME